MTYNEYEHWCMDRKHKPVISTMFYRRMEAYGLQKIRRRAAEDDKQNKVGGIYKFELPEIDDAKVIFRRETSIHIEGDEPMTICIDPPDPNEEIQLPNLGLFY